MGEINWRCLTLPKVTKNRSRRVGFYLKHLRNLWMVFVEKSCNPVINSYPLAHDGGVSHA
jgi:hypothetical protein